MLTILPRWKGNACVVAATGPSLTEDVAARCAGMNVIAINDAYRLFPDAAVLYACDERWWDVHGGCPGFSGEKWSSHGSEHYNDKRGCAEKYGINLVKGADGEGFSLDPERIHYGNNSGFQAVNLAILFGASPIILVGFNMKVAGKRHFFGDHPGPLSNATDFVRWVPKFATAAEMLPPQFRIINATPDTALTCFEQMELADALTIAPQGCGGDGDGRHIGHAAETAHAY